MGKVWVLDTSTKGTGAQMVPLESVLKPPEPVPSIPAPVQLPGGPTPSAEPEPRQPRRFRVIDAMTRQVLADDADARAAVDMLDGIRSLVDVSIHVWEPGSRRWRPLTLGERKVMWSARGRGAAG